MEFLHSLAQGMAVDLESRGHKVEFIVQPGVGHEVTDECLRPMLDWLRARPHCGTTTPGGWNGDAGGDADGDWDADAGDGGFGGDGVQGGCECSSAGTVSMTWFLQMLSCG